MPRAWVDCVNYFVKIIDSEDELFLMEIEGEGDVCGHVRHALECWQELVKNIL